MPPTQNTPENAATGVAGFRAPIPGPAPENAASTPLQRLQTGFCPVLVGIHGILSKGADSTDLILAEAAAHGHRVLEFDWGPRPPLVSRAFVNLHARRLIERLEREHPNAPVFLVTHSFGAKIGKRALNLGLNIIDWWMFNGAAPARASFPPHQYRNITVVVNERDRVLRLSRVAGWLQLGYGDIGRRGYLGDSPRVHTRHETASGWRQHGQSFQPAPLKAWAGEIAATMDDYRRAHRISNHE